MSTLKIPATRGQKPREGHQIHSGDFVLVRLPNGDVKSLKVDANTTVNIPKFASFFANELIGQPYGLTYQIVNKKLEYMPPQTLQEVEDTDANNQLINDDRRAQALTVDEIHAMKKASMSADEIIQKQIEQHANYALKTEYSKEKYKKRSRPSEFNYIVFEVVRLTLGHRYLKSFTIIEPTLYNVCEFWFTKDQHRLRDLRVDSLSQMLNLANVRPGGRYIVVDDASGMIVAAMLDRMGGEGRIMSICHTDSPPAYPIIPHMNFNAATSSILASLNWATAEEEHISVLPPSDVAEDQLRSDRQRQRLGKRKVISDLLESIREELFAGEFDGLLISSDYDTYSMIERLIPYVAGSGSIVVHSPFVQPLVDLQAHMRTVPQFLCPSVSEVWLRKYQVLPGRMHPMMAMSGSGGFLLQTIKIFDDPSAAGTPKERRRKKPKVKEDADMDDSSPQTPAASTSVTPLASSTTTT